MTAFHPAPQTQSEDAEPVPRMCWGALGRGTDTTYVEGTGIQYAEPAH